MACDRSGCVARTAGLESTRRSQHRSQGDLIEPDHTHHDGANRFHPCPRAACRSLSSSLRRIGADRFPAPRRAITTTSDPPEIRLPFHRNHSLTRRLIRFRATAPPTFRLTVSPNRLGSSALSRSLTSTTKELDAALRPVCDTRRKSRADRIRSSRPKRPLAPFTRYFEGLATTRRFRPFARRRFRISRPARVLIRARKPCRRLRRIRLGW